MVFDTVRTRRLPCQDVVATLDIGTINVTLASDVLGFIKVTRLTTPDRVREVLCLPFRSALLPVVEGCADLVEWRGAVIS